MGQTGGKAAHLILTKRRKLWHSCCHNCVSGKNKHSKQANNIFFPNVMSSERITKQKIDFLDK